MRDLYPMINASKFLLILVCLVVSGCALVRLKEDLKPLEQLVLLEGSVERADPSDKSTLIVVPIIREGEKPKIANYQILAGGEEQPVYRFPLHPGVYRLWAFVDSNRNLAYKRHPYFLSMEQWAFRSRLVK